MKYVKGTQDYKGTVQYCLANLEKGCNLVHIIMSDQQ